MKPKGLNSKAIPRSTKFFQENLGVGAPWGRVREEVDDVVMASWGKVEGRTRGEITECIPRVLSYED